MEVRIECTLAEYERLKEILPEVCAVTIKGTPQPQKSREEKYPPQFEEFWSVYPRRDGKTDAFRSWNARINEGAPHEMLTKCAKNYGDYMRQEQTESKFIMQPATFLGPNRRWQEWKESRLTAELPFRYVP